MIYGVDIFTINDIIAILSNPKKAQLNEEARAKILKSQQNVQQIVASDRTVYGINTGFGPLCDVKISEDETAQLQYNLIISHAVGVGKPIAKDLSKVMMIAKIHALSRGFSGVSLEVIERLIIMVEKDIIPVVPEQGSVGASGDLAPLAHLVLPLLGLGKVWQNDEIKDESFVLEFVNNKIFEIKVSTLKILKRLNIDKFNTLLDESSDPQFLKIIFFIKKD